MQSLEKRLARNEDLKTKYQKTVKQYIYDNHATKISPEDLTPEKASATLIINYNPHHAVLNQCKPDKVREVYDAAARYRNSSLNDHLLKGPDLLKNLVSIVIRFRLGQFAVTKDIEQMFHHLQVRKDDQDALQFLWRENLYMFWKRFIQEYLPMLNIRKKWNREKCDFKENELVIMKNKHQHRSLWSVGRIILVNKGIDGKFQ